MIQSVKAAVLRNIGGPMTIEEVEISGPERHEVLVRTKAVGLCHSDLHVIDGHLPMPLPTVLGHEAAGVVERVGEGVTNVKEGDHVIVCAVFHCGRCDQCLSGHANLCTVSVASRAADQPPRLTAGDEPLFQFCGTGSFAEYMVVQESGCVPIRKDMPFDRACLVSCGVATGFGAVNRTARVSPGERVAVIGCGGVVLAAVNGAAIAGARRIIAIDRVPMKLDLARKLGATDIIEAGADVDVVGEVMRLTDNAGVDHAIEAIGLPQTATQAFAMLRRGGTATIAGVLMSNLELPGLALLHERRVQGSFMGGVRPSIDIPRYVDLYMQGRLRIDELISKRIRLDEINQGFADLAGGAVVRAVIEFD